LKLERLIEKLWRRSPFFWKREKKAANERILEPREKDNAFNIEIKVDGENGAPEFEDYEPTNMIYTRSLGIEHKKWQRVNQYFWEVSNLEETRENRFNAKLEAMIFGKT
jgi:hypothetical protein